MDSKDEIFQRFEDQEIDSCEALKLLKMSRAEFWAELESWREKQYAQSISRFAGRLRLPEDRLEGEGIEVLYDPVAQEIRLQGWYDQGMGIGGENMTMPLREFFDRLGITQEDCNRLFEKDDTNQHNERSTP